MVSPSRLARLLAALALCLFVTACGKNKLTTENFDKLKDGMSVAEAEKLLGKGDREGDAGNSSAGAVGGVDLGGGTSGGGTVYVFERGDRKVRLTFRQDKLVHKMKEGF